MRTHDFMDKELGKAIPYGVYDVAADAGWVNVGTEHDTARSPSVDPPLVEAMGQPLTRTPGGL